MAYKKLSVQVQGWVRRNATFEKIGGKWLLIIFLLIIVYFIDIINKV